MLIFSGMVIIAGCQWFPADRRVTVQDPGAVMKVDSGVPGSDLTVPAALDDPESFRKVSYRPIPKNSAPAAAKEKRGKKRTALQKAKPEKGTAAVPRSPENFRRGPGLWRAFTRLPQEEQRTLLKLQRSNPEEFRRIMQHKVDQLYEQDRIHRQELDKLAEAYRMVSAALDEEPDEMRHLLRSVGHSERGIMNLNRERTSVANRHEIRFGKRAHHGNRAFHRHIKRWRIVR